MGTMTIDGRKVKFTDEKNVLNVIRNSGVQIPTMCYHSEMSTFGACRLCSVEDDRGRIFASCAEVPRDGMVIYTNTARLKKYRKMIVELLLAAHCRDCTTCPRSGNCVLQDLSMRLNVTDVRFEDTRPRREIDDSSLSIIRDPNKCILCGDCVRACEEMQGVGVLGFTFRGTEATVMPAFDVKIADTNCVGCGQCRVYCPTGAITIHDNTQEVWDVLADKDVRVVCQVAPSVRVAVGEAFGVVGKNVMGRVVNALHIMGFDEVYDTAFSADMTIMEEATEFVDRFKNGGVFPLMTSCCPGWVKYVTDNEPELIPNLSTARSPQGMMSAAVKEYYRDPKNAAGKKTIMVSIMPCTAKKMEARRPNSYTYGEPDTDIVITTTELIQMIKDFGIEFDRLTPQASDVPFGFGSGGGVLFGVTGGVMESALRWLLPEHSKEALDAVANSGVRGEDPVKEFTVEYEGQTLNMCVVNGLANVKGVLEKVKSGEKQYHMIEVMACRRGCIMGGGQPAHGHITLRQKRAKGIYNADNMSIIKKPDENPMLINLYETLLHGKQHELLHNQFY